MKNLKYYFLLSGFLILILSACEESERDLKQSGRSLKFTGQVFEGWEPETRGPEAGNIFRDDYDTNFYMEMVVKEKNNEDIKMDKCGTYRVPIQRPGVFNSYATTDSLNWVSTDENHTFYAWTMPWIEMDGGKDPYVADSDDYLKDNTFISFIGSHDMYGGKENTNCKILETFIGAMNGPVQYQNNGEYVNLQFKHLVSKIYIETLRYTYTEADGSIQNKSVHGTITFTGIPSGGYFIRKGDDGPFIESDGSNQVSYEIGSGMYLYIFPGVDFSKVSFRISASGVETAGDFLGDFKSIAFTRDPDDWWDKKYSDEHTLYAGEMMTMVINLRQGRGTSVSVSIGDWTTQTPREGSVYPHPGIFDDTDLNTLYRILDEEKYSEEVQKRMYELYGNGNGEFELYNDVDGIVHGVRIGRDYVLNGNGFTINFSEPYNDNGLIRVRISRMKNIYLSDNMGHKIYINDNFEIFIVNDDGSMTETAYSLKELENGNNAYTLNLVTGAVSQTTSY